MDDIALVRKYEPVLRFSKDDAGREERFFPMAVDDFVAEAALYRKRQGLVTERGALTLDDLGRYSPTRSRELYLTFAASELLKQNPSLRERLAHGGLSLFSVDGTVTPQLVVDDAASFAFAAADPGLQPITAEGRPDEALSFSPGTAPAGGEVSYALVDAMQLPDEIRDLALERYEPYRAFGQHPPRYYYNLFYNRGYRILQYWFFYAYNDWGSGHGGMNDHEGDWEMVTLFLQDDEPRYAAYSAHIGKPEWHAWSSQALQKWDGTHPIVYVAAGSHANYYRPGVQKVVTFRDFSHGNSAVTIGPGAAHAWGEPQAMMGLSWVHNYAGGWGALLKRFGSSWLAPGAQAPTGPAWQYERWEAPVAWAGLRE